MRSVALGLGLLLAACSPEVAGAGSPAGEPVLEEGLSAARSPAPVTLAARTEPDPEHARRSAHLGERFRARIAHWTDEARRISKGKAHAGNVRVSVALRELGAGADLVSIAADEPRRPASNMKLVTTAAALVLLGRQAAWVTPVEALGPLGGGLLAGDLVLRAAGDPLCAGDDPAAAEERLRELARELRAAGVERIQGDLVLDEGTFLAPGPGPGWPDPSQHWTEYCALAGGFSANGGVLHALVRAGAVGAPASVEVHPAPHGLRSAYDVRTISRPEVDVRVGATASTATVKGVLGQSLGEFEAEFAHPDPVRLFGELFRAALDSAGIALDGELRRARGSPRGVRLAELRSGLAETLEPINSESRNGVADQVFLSLGQAVAGEGTRAGGGRAIALALERLGVEGSGLVQVDGSGLSRDNRITARAVTALLEHVLGTERETARLYRESLAVAGRKGTLEERLGGTHAEGRVRAKTGWIAGVSALSGYVEPETGRPAVFSILIEYPSELSGLNTSCFKKLQDELVLLLFTESG